MSRVHTLSAGFSPGPPPFLPWAQESSHLPPTPAPRRRQCTGRQDIVFQGGKHDTFGAFSKNFRCIFCAMMHRDAPSEERGRDLWGAATHGIAWGQEP